MTSKELDLYNRMLSAFPMECSRADVAEEGYLSRVQFLSWFNRVFQQSPIPYPLVWSPCDATEAEAKAAGQWVGDAAARVVLGLRGLPGILNAQGTLGRNDIPLTDILEGYDKFYGGWPDRYSLLPAHAVVNQMIVPLKARGHRGPYLALYATDWAESFKEFSPKSPIPEVHVPQLPRDTLVVLQRTPDVIQLEVGCKLKLIHWNEGYVSLERLGAEFRTDFDALSPSDTEGLGVRRRLWRVLTQCRAIVHAGNGIAILTP